jgi:hypothetical protein
MPSPICAESHPLVYVLGITGVACGRSSQSSLPPLTRRS